MKDLDKSAVDKSGVEKKIVLGHMRWRPSWCSSRGGNTKKENALIHAIVCLGLENNMSVFAWPNIFWFISVRNQFKPNQKAQALSVVSITSINQIKNIYWMWAHLLMTVKYTLYVAGASK